MPYTQGRCEPWICTKTEFNLAGARLTAFVTATGAAVTTPAKLQLVELAFGSVYSDFLDTLREPRRLSCDGCICSILNPNAPWVPLPPITIAVDPASGYTIQASGIRARVKWGVCLPPGSKVKIGNGPQIAVEDLVDGEMPKSGAGGHKKGKKKPGKKPKRKTRRR